jgi:Holliday junction resolvase
MKTPESYEKAEIKKYLDSIGAWYFCPYMAGFGKSGVPDIVACIQGQFWAIEVKRPGKTPTKLQSTRIEEILKAGGFALAGTADTVILHIKEVHKIVNAR